MCVCKVALINHTITDRKIDINRQTYRYRDTEIYLDTYIDTDLDMNMKKQRTVNSTCPRPCLPGRGHVGGRGGRRELQREPRLRRPLQRPLPPPGEDDPHLPHVARGVLLLLVPPPVLWRPARHKMCVEEGEGHSVFAYI